MKRLSGEKVLPGFTCRVARLFRVIIPVDAPTARAAGSYLRRADLI